MIVLVQVKRKNVLPDPKYITLSAHLGNLLIPLLLYILIDDIGKKLPFDNVH